MDDILLSVAVGTSVFLSLHLFLWQTFPSNSPRIRLLGMLGVFGVLSSCLFEILRGGTDPLTLYAIVSLNILCLVAYAFFYAGIARSVSVTLMGRLLITGRDPAPFSLLLKEYVQSPRFSDRLDLMGKTGLVERIGAKLTLTSKGRRLAANLLRLSHLLSTNLQG